MSDTPAASAVAATGADVLAALAAQPGGPQLLRLARDREDLALVGGAVRDLLCGRVPRELDVILTGEVEPLARELATAIGASTTLHGRFGTAVVEWEAGRIDLAQRRAESYPAPGALPEVRAGTAAEDLRRRDFTVNAIALPLAGPHRGELEGAEHALADLAAGRLRVLHERSFRDDPTRLLRLARYQARLGFTLEASTAELAAQAVSAGALATVSHARIGAELRLALREADPLASLHTIDSLGLLVALHPHLRFDRPLAQAALDLLAAAGAGEGRGARTDLLALAVLLRSAALAGGYGVECELERLLDALEFPGPDRALVMQAAIHADALAGGLAHARTGSEVHLAASQASLEGVALAGAWGELRSGGEASEAADAARRWLAELRHVHLLIDGEDLLAAGVPQGPEIGRRLQAALLRKLDGELQDGHEAELNVALREQT